MIKHGKVRSTLAPESLVIDDMSVWVHSNIKAVEDFTTDIMDEEVFTGFEYDVVQYEKNEYIKILAEKNSNLESELTSTQLALVEIYEGMDENSKTPKPKGALFFSRS